MATYPGQVIGAPQLSIGAVLARAFAAIGAMPLGFGGVALVLIGAPSLAFRLLTGALFTPEHLRDLARLWPALVAGALGYWLTYLFAQTLFFLLTDAAGERRRPGAGALLGAALRVLPAVFVQSILFTLALTVASLFLLVPGLLLWLLWGMAAPSLTLERSGVFAAFGRSARLTAGSRWHLVAILLLVFALYFVASGAVGMVSLAMTGLVRAGMATGPAFVVTAALSTLLQMAFAVIWSAIKAALFLELRELKDGPAGERLAGIFA